MTRSIAARVAYAREFLLRPENAWIEEDRAPALAALDVDPSDEARLSQLESIGPSLARQHSASSGELDLDDRPLHEILLFLALMRQLQGPTRSVRWRKVHFFLQDGELVAERRPDTS